MRGEPADGPVILRQGYAPEPESRICGWAVIAIRWSLRANHLLETGVHFFFLDELASVSLRNAIPHGRAKSRVLLKLRFLLCSELDVHCLQSNGKRLF